MTQLPLLHPPNFSEPFILETDACNTGICAVLLQVSKPVAFLSKALPPTTQGLSTYEKELWALIYAVTKWTYYLYGRHFIIRNEHQSLKYLLEQRLTILLQQKWLTKQLAFDYTIEYKKGALNVPADCISRMYEDSPTCHALSVLQPAWVFYLEDSWVGDTLVQTLISSLTINKTASSDYTFHQGVLRYKNRMYVGATGSLRYKV
ncbi:hypothetical protein ACHQM5_020426 [Ranunculus cassubicifolius]